MIITDVHLDLDEYNDVFNGHQRAVVMDPHQNLTTGAYLNVCLGRWYIHPNKPREFKHTYEGKMLARITHVKKVDDKVMVSVRKVDL